MVTYVLIHGAGGDSWYWHRVTPLLAALGHDVIAVDLPCDDDRAGLSEYADCVVDAVDHHADVDRPADVDVPINGRGVILVAQSMGGFTAPLVTDRLDVSLIVLLAAMVPRVGESPGEWWTNTGHVFPDPFDPEQVFAHDLPPDVAADLATRVRRQSDTPFEKPWPLATWPDVPTRFLLCRDDRFFPAPFLRRVVVERLGIAPDEMDGGHLPALARPAELVERLERYRLGIPPR